MVYSHLQVTSDRSRGCQHSTNCKRPWRRSTDRIGTATVAIGRDRRGTGVVIADGRVLTNAHNLRDRTTQITFADGRTAQAEVLGADPDGDLVVRRGRHVRGNPRRVVDGSTHRRPGGVRRGPRSVTACASPSVS